MSAMAALQVLFELLEEYAPTWYTEKHRDLAISALGQSAEPHPLELKPGKADGPALTDFHSPQRRRPGSRLAYKRQ